MRKRLTMLFAGTNRDRTLSVQNPTSDLDASTVNLAAGSFILANPFDEQTCPITALKRADIITTEELVLI